MRTFTLSYPNITLSLHGGFLPVHHLSAVDHPISITSPFKLFSDCAAHTKFHARITTPEGIDVALYAGHVLPDVLIFDGLPTAFTPTLTITTPKTPTMTCHRHLTSPPYSDHTPLCASA
jgi:hypothetical protein